MAMTQPTTLGVFLTHNQRRWVLIGLLILLHLLLLQGIGSAVGRMLLVVHIGLFILWQPFVRAELQLSGLQFALIASAVGAATFWASTWMMIVWVMTLAGIVGGKVFFFAGRWAKFFYLIVLAYLICILLVVLVPQVLPDSIVLPGEYLSLAKYVLPALFFVMATVPIEQEAEDEAEVVDFVYSIFVFLLLAVLVLGSVSAVLLIKRSYFDALILTIIALATVLLILGWAWNPRLGFAGFGVFFSRYLLRLGLPFERWLHDLAENMQRVEQPEAFLSRSLEGMLGLPWVNGSEWQVPGAEGGTGRREGRRSVFSHGPLTLAVYTEQPLSPALVWHFDLLAQLLSEFYEAKLRSQELQQLSYIKAIHQTGARLTHDVKNLLQSLNALCLAAKREDEMSTPAYQALLRRQLPALSQRLQQTLDKLRRPEMEESKQFIAGGSWWEELQARYARNGVLFSQVIPDKEVAIPVTLFNSAAENFLENAITKRKELPGLQISAQFTPMDKTVLIVSDDGPAIPAEVADKLFISPVASRNGLGIGLFQVARHAAHFGFELRVAVNMTGRVCFELRRLEKETVAD